MVHTKYQSSMPSSFSEEEFWSFLLCSYVWTCDPRGRASFDPKSVNKLGRGPLGDATYQISKLFSFQFQRRRILKFPSLFLCSNLWPPGQGRFWLKGHHMNKLGRGPLEDAIYQISKLYAFQFQWIRILKFSFFVPVFKLVTPGTAPVLTPRASFEWTW